jgi:hypothetical protein
MLFSQISGRLSRGHAAAARNLNSAGATSACQRSEIYLKELMPETMQPQRATDQIDQSQWVLSLHTSMNWLPDQGSNLGPAD